MDRNRFLQNVADSRLLDPAVLDQVRDAPGETDVELARNLVKQGRLTRWQAEQLLSGRTEFQLGKYRLISELGRGGMGAVFQAEQVPLGRVVALKVMATHLVRDATAVARFRREIQAAAALTHPNIVTAIDADHVGNTHFLVMEYCAGEPLSAVLAREGRLPVAVACEYIRQAAEGLQHAGERGMVHRDIKPSNLLVTRGPDGEPVVKVLDLGLARFTSEARGEQDLTNTGQVMGTPDYVAPEQARSTKTADIRADIFSLGCTLFRALTGKLPFGGETVMEKLMARGMSDAPRLREVDPSLPEELERIVARMLERDPARRYQTPREVARDLGPFARPQTQEPTVRMTAPAQSSAQPTLSDTVVTTGTRPVASVLARKSAERRTAILFGAGLVAALALLGGYWWWEKSGETTVVLSWPAAERDGAALEMDGRSRPLPKEETITLTGRPGKRTIRLVRAGYLPVTKSFSLGRGETTRFQPTWAASAETVRRQEWTKLQGQLTAVSQRLGGFADVRAALTDQTVSDVRRQLVGFLVDHPTSNEGNAARNWIARLPWPADGLSADAIPESDREAAAVSANLGTAELVAVLGEHRSPHWGTVRKVLVLPSGSQFVSVSGNQLALWDIGQQTAVFQAPLDGGSSAVLVGEDTLACVGLDVTVWSVQGSSLRLERRLPCPEWGEYVAIHPNKELLAVACRDLSVRFYDLSQSEPRQARVIAGADAEHINSIAFTPDGGTLIVGGHSRQIAGYDVTGSEPKQKWRIPAHGDWVYAVAVSPDGTRMASAGAHDRTFKLWDLTQDSPRELAALSINDAACAVTFTPDGKRLVAGTWNGHVVLWKIDTQPITLEWNQPAHAHQVWSVAFTGNGFLMVTGGEDARVNQWDLSGEQPAQRHVPKGHNAPITAAALTPDGTILATGSGDGAVRFWDLATGELSSAEWNLGEPVEDLAFRSDGRNLAAGTTSGQVRLWDRETASERLERSKYPSHVTRLAFLPASETLAVAGEAPQISLWDTSAPGATVSLQPKQSTSGLAISPDGRSLVVRSPEGVSTVWDLQARREAFTVDLAASTTGDIAYLPDGRALAIAHGTQLTFWDVEKRRSVGEYSAAGLLPLVTVAPCGAVAAAGMVIHVWGEGLDSPSDTIEFAEHAEPMGRCLLSPEGRHVITANRNGTIYVIRRKAWRP